MKVKKDAKIQLRIIYKLSSYKYLIDEDKLNEVDKLYKILGMMEYVMKHIHQRDMIKLWEKFLQAFKLEILVDKEKDYIYLTAFLWYTDAKLPEEAKWLCCINRE